MNNNQGRRRTRRVRQQRKQKNTQISRILLTICMIALVAVVSIGGTIAWLTAKTDQITNTFTASGIEVVLEETGADENDAKSYQMIPGKAYSKDPKATFTYDVDAYLFIQVDESWKLGNYNLKSYLSYELKLAKDGWTQGNEENELPTNVWYQEKSDVTAKTILKQQILVGGATDENGQVTVNNGVTNEMMKALEAEGATNPTLSFQAFAIQKHGFDTVKAAWDEVSKNP